MEAYLDPSRQKVLVYVLYCTNFTALCIELELPTSVAVGAMTTTRAAGERGGGGFDVDRLLNFEKRSGIKDGEIETFITKVDAVNAAIQAMKASKDWIGVCLCPSLRSCGFVSPNVHIFSL